MLLGRERELETLRARLDGARLAQLARLFAAEAEPSAA